MESQQKPMTDEVLDYKVHSTTIFSFPINLCNYLSYEIQKNKRKRRQSKKKKTNLMFNYQSKY